MRLDIWRLIGGGLAIRLDIWLLIRTQPACLIEWSSDQKYQVGSWIKYTYQKIRTPLFKISGAQKSWGGEGSSAAMGWRRSCPHWERKVDNFQWLSMSLTDILTERVRWKPFKSFCPQEMSREMLQTAILGSIFHTKTSTNQKLKCPR